MDGARMTLRLVGLHMLAKRRQQRARRLAPRIKNHQDERGLPRASFVLGIEWQMIRKIIKLIPDNRGDRLKTLQARRVKTVR